MIALSEVPRVVTFIETGSRWWMPGTGEGEKGKLLFFKRYRVSVWEDAEVLEMDGGDGCTAVSIY